MASREDMIINFDSRDVAPEELKSLLQILGWESKTHGISEMNENNHHILFAKERESRLTEFKELRVQVEYLQLDLEDFNNIKNWTRPYDHKGKLINEHALFRPKLKEPSAKDT